MPFMLLVSLIVVHELGHFLAAIIFKFDVDKIYIYPFGGVSKFSIDLNESIFKEFIVLMMGPVFQIIFFILLCKISYFNSYIKILEIYNYTILFFNLLPIYPLDGGKLLNLLLSINISYKRSFNISIIISYLTITVIFIIYLFNNIKLNILVILSFLLFKVLNENKKKNYLFDKFLLERYLNKYDFKKRKSVSDISEFTRMKKHIVRKNNRYYTEREILNNKFNNRY